MKVTLDILERRASLNIASLRYQSKAKQSNNIYKPNPPAFDKEKNRESKEVAVFMMAMKNIFMCTKLEL